MIADLLPRYFEVYGQSHTYKVLRSWVICAHEVAWMELRGTLKGQTHTSRALFCECDFAEGVGWKINKNGRPRRLNRQKKCIYRGAAIDSRRYELRTNYLDRYDRYYSPLVPAREVLRQNFPSILNDLMARAKEGEFIGEDDRSARLRGGYFHLETVAVILGLLIEDLRVDVEQSASKKWLSYDGSIIKPYSG